MLATFNRTDCALRTIRAACEKLKCSRDIYWYLADAGSTEEHYTACKEELAKYGARVVGTHHIYFSAGHNWNMALDFIYDRFDFHLRLEDDFELTKELDITKYVEALDQREDWGIVRLGLLPVGLDSISVGHAGIHYLRYYRTTQYAYSGNPLIMHIRFWRHYGKYHLDFPPGMTEVEYDGRFREKQGPEIVWPVDLGGWGVFGHIGKEKSI